MSVNKIGKKIKELRENRNLSQTDLEKIAKINSHLISKYETGVAEPTISNLRKLATSLQVTTDYLIFDGEKEKVIEFANPVLKKQISLISNMSKKDQEIISCFLDAFIKKNQMEGILKG